MKAGKRQNPSMSSKPNTLIFEKGITLCRAGKSWRCITSRDKSLFAPRTFSSTFEVRPIIRISSSGTLLLSSVGQKHLTTRIMNISNYQPVQFHPYDPTRLSYTLRDVKYHLERLVENCSDLCIRCNNHPFYGQIGDGAKVLIQEWVEPCWFEIESCIAFIVRAYDLLNYHISPIVLTKRRVPKS